MDAKVEYLPDASAGIEHQSEQGQIALVCCAVRFFGEVEIAFPKYLFGISQSVPFGPLWVLPLVERFAFGGLGMGEAFDPASLVGDSGGAAKLELGRAHNLHVNALQSATAYIKADYGVAWSNASYLPRRDDAASISVGVLGKWPHTLGTVELSAPVHQPSYSPAASAVRALASLALTF